MVKIKFKVSQKTIALTMMRYTFFILAIISVAMFSCGKKSKKYGRKFFTYDHIDYYFVDSDERLGRIRLDTSRSEFDSIKAEFAKGNVPLSISDTSSIRLLDSMGYHHLVIDAKYFPSLDSVFAEKTIDKDEGLYTTCSPIYRNVLVFRRQNRITGIAKVCFHCFMIQMTGAIESKYLFGSDGEDFVRLEEILWKYRDDPMPL